MALSLALKGSLQGHSGWVTAIATSSADPNMIVTSSRDKSLIVWEINRDEGSYGVPKKSLHGHSHFIQDVALSQDGHFALSASWDKTLRLWHLADGKAISFVGHNNDVLSVSFSSNNRLIVSASRDRTIKVWNTVGTCMHTITDDNHSEWVSCIRFSPNPDNASFVSCGWDKVVKVWDSEQFKLRTNHYGHTGYVNTVTVSPDGSLCASGGKDGWTMLWDLSDSKHLYSLAANDEVHALCFSPVRYWLCAATTSAIVIWNLETKEKVEELRPEWAGSSGQNHYCVSLAWSPDGQTLYGGYTDNNIYVYGVVSRY